jgi:hypothetical protein
MKRKVIALFVPLAAILLVLGYAVAPASADTVAFWGNVCDGDSQCINQTAGEKGGLLQFWGHTTQGEPNNDWNLWTVQGYPTVNCSDGYPFGGTLYISSSECESWGINGDPVYKIAWAPKGKGSGYCMYAGAYQGGNNGELDTYSCSPTGSTENAFLYVWAFGGFLISAYGTAYNFLLDGSQQIAYVGTCAYDNNSDADGNDVCLTQTNPLQFHMLSPP